MLLRLPTQLMDHRSKSWTHSAGRWLITALVVLTMLATRVAVTAAETDEETEEPPPPVPFAVINAAGVDRLLADAQYVFEAAERPELMDWLNEGLGFIGNLDGVDRTKPFGAFLYLDSGLPPIPFPVTYIPVENEQRLLETMSTKLRMNWTKSGTSDSVYETTDRFGLHMRFANGYAYIVDRGDWILEEELPDPVAYNEPLTNRYDIAASLRIGAVPLGIRTVFLTFLRTSTETELQQRDNEPDAAYRVRRANGVSMLEALEQLLTEGDEVRVGWDASREQRTGVLEIVFNAVPDSDYAKHLKTFAGTTTTFHPLVNDSQPLTFVASWKLDEREQKAYQEYLLAAREAIELRLTEQEKPIAPVAGLYDSLAATVEEGMIDVCLQFAAPQPQEFVIRGGVKLKGARTFGTSLTEFLTQIQGTPDVGQIEISHAEHQGVMIHRIAHKEEDSDEEGRRIFGGDPDFYFGVGPQAFWFALGADSALPQLKQAIDLVRASAGQPPPSAAAPIQFVSRMNAWLKLPPRDRDENDGPPTFRLLSDEAFAGDDDALRIDIRPTETGARFRIQLDEGYLRLLGLAIGRQYDRSQL